MKKIGAITIGQAPRTDVMEDLDDILRGDVELIQAGALDLLTLEEVETLRPDGTGNTLVSRMRDGTGVMLQEQKILPLLQQRIHDLEEQGVSAILIMCTGEFPVETVIPVQWNPYLESESESAVSRLRDEQVDLAVMDCFGYSRKMRDFAAQSLGKPVILSRTMAARVLLEIV